MHFRKRTSEIQRIELNWTIYFRIVSKGSKKLRIDLFATAV